MATLIPKARVAAVTGLSRRALYLPVPSGPIQRPRKDELEIRPYVFGLAEPSLSEPLSGDVRVPSPHVESSHQFVDGLGDHLPPPQPPK